MDTQLERLIELAGLDLRIAGLNGKLAAVPPAIEKHRTKYLESEARLEETREKLAAMQKEHRQAEGDLEGHLAKISKLNDQTSLVKTNKEYQTLLQEIENLKGQQDSYEERILELMEESVAAERRIEEVKKDVAAAKDVFEVEEGKLRAEESRLREVLSKIEGEKNELLPTIEQENQHLYTRVKTLRGDAVAEVKNELCLGCRVSLPPQKYADVMGGKSIQICAHCNRILFFRREKAVPPREPA